MSFLKKMTLLLIAMPTLSWAESDLCGVVNNVSQIVACAESKSPDIKKAEANLKIKKASEEFAGQLQNPELSTEYVAGSSSGKNQSEMDLSLAFPIEVGGGRSARKSLASFESKRAELELIKVRADVRKQTLLNLTRVRQICDELSMIQDSLDAFSKLIRQYNDRPKLTPEQEVTLTVFSVAKTDYSFKKAEYEDELAKLDTYFKILIDHSISDLKVALPAKIAKWPAISQSSEESPLLAIYDSDIGASRADLAKSKSEIWPSISIGPSFKRVTDGDQSVSQLGVNLSMPLPVLSMNNGGRAVSMANVLAAETRRDLAVKELKAARNSAYQQYVKSVKLLQESASGISQEARHKKVENLFFRGLVPSSLVIEAHRTLVDFGKTRNERELKALENFFDIQIIDGKAVELNL